MINWPVLENHIGFCVACSGIFTKILKLVLGLLLKIETRTLFDMGFSEPSVLGGHDATPQS